MSGTAEEDEAVYEKADVAATVDGEEEVVVGGGDGGRYVAAEDIAVDAVADEMNCIEDMAEMDVASCPKAALIA